MNYYLLKLNRDITKLYHQIFFLYYFLININYLKKFTLPLIIKLLFNIYIYN